MRVAVGIMAGVLWAALAWAVSVDNVRFRQTADDQVVVTYDLEAGHRPVTVELWVSQDGGRTYTMRPESVSGDVGEAVHDGKGKWIVWDVFADIRKLEGGAFVFKVVVTAQAGGGEITVELPGGAKMEFVWIEPGTFMMGSPWSEPGRDDDENLHSVTIVQGFYLGKYEITQEQWKSVMGNNPSDYERPRHPVETVSWEDVQVFIGRLNTAAGKVIYRLPTEAEWEYACRAGTTTRWSFGDDESRLGDYAWYAGNNSPSGMKEVGLKLPNPWGLYDMHGNVWEWVRDWYGYYSIDAEVDPTGALRGSLRVGRGGYFDSFARDLRSADRSGGTPSVRGWTFGARLLRKE